jgi:hypothetical protein
MNVQYCDICLLPIKDEEIFQLYLSQPRPGNFINIEEYKQYLEKVEKEVKDICPTCKHIIDRIFELRLRRLSELTEEIILTFNLPSKKNPVERKKGKKHDKEK